MLYPRETKEGVLIADDQMVGYREHLTQKHRVLFLTGAITSETESHNLLMALDSLNHDPIKIVVTSPGGDLDSAFLLYDTMRLVQSPILTLGRYCVSAASLLLAAGSERYLLPHAKVMLHDISGQLGGMAHDIASQYEQITLYKAKLIDLYLDCGVKRTREELSNTIEHEFWLEPKEAIEYGLADKIMDKKTLKEWLTWK